MDRQPNSDRPKKPADHQLNNSLTSMEWLFPLAINKNMLCATSPKLKVNSPALPTPHETALVPIPLDCAPASQPAEPGAEAHSYSAKGHFTFKAAANSHSIAQRAEPHRPIDLSAEYKCADPVKRDGKPPYSYVNLCTFAINSSPKKKMTLNEIYQVSVLFGEGSFPSGF